MNKKKRLRTLKNLLIMPGFQGRMIFFVVLVGLVSTGINGYLYYSYVVGSYDLILGYSNLPQEIKDQRYDDLFVFGASLAVATLVVTLVVAFWALFMTHRAAGSVFHLMRVIKEITNGNLAARVHLRPKDEFQELATSFNGMMDEMQKRLGTKTGTGQPKA